MNFESLGITFNLPNFTTIFDKGVASGISWILSFAFTGLIVIWVISSIIAAYKITTSGLEKEYETGLKTIKNIWVSATVGLLFFGFISLIGAFIGIGGVTEWNYTLSQCKNSSGGFYFMDISTQEFYGIEGSNIKCCKITSLKNMPTELKESNFKENTYHYIINPDSTWTDECVDLK